MKLEDINFVERRGHYNNINEVNSGITVKNVKVGKNVAVSFTFYNLDFLKGFTYIRIGYAGNRVYFIPSNNKDDYKLTRTHARYEGVYKIAPMGHKSEPFKSFVKESGYRPKLDEECGLWFIEKEG